MITPTLHKVILDRMQKTGKSYSECAGFFSYKKKKVQHKPNIRESSPESVRAFQEMLRRNKLD